MLFQHENGYFYDHRHTSTMFTPSKLWDDNVTSGYCRPSFYNYPDLRAAAF
ncbi:hypothetical protein HQN90_27315 [Paenibacillus alba]|uniref:hypothetical protein n=1 Tax=Paenibacillus alba TaxID=1197127 RepID=UPI001565BDD1|nr:hypothetical protein [Paenibacillus alba]NQX69848.1 hypothetical protein [Paenibacillus alba]